MCWCYLTNSTRKSSACYCTTNIVQFVYDTCIQSTDRRSSHRINLECASIFVDSMKPIHGHLPLFTEKCLNKFTLWNEIYWWRWHMYLLQQTRVMLTLIRSHCVDDIPASPLSEHYLTWKCIPSVQITTCNPMIDPLLHTTFDDWQINANDIDSFV